MIKPYNRRCDVYSFGICCGRFIVVLFHPDLAFADVISAFVQCWSVFGLVFVYLIWIQVGLVRNNVKITLSTNIKCESGEAAVDGGSR
ncbi:hypothetical protein YC2023_061400 [Brassica napus]